MSASWGDRRAERPTSYTRQDREVIPGLFLKGYFCSNLGGTLRTRKTTRKSLPPRSSRGSRESGARTGAELLFELGQTVSTPGALSALTRREIAQALTRHHRGDWGDVGRFDAERNEEALTGGERLVSVYHGADGTKFYVITEADRSSTCVLLPEEY